VLPLPGVPRTPLKIVEKPEAMVAN